MSNSRPKSGNPVELRQLVVGVGGAMVAAGDAVDIIESSLRRILEAYRVTDFEDSCSPVPIARPTTSLTRRFGLSRPSWHGFNFQPLGYISRPEAELLADPQEGDPVLSCQPVHEVLGAI
jgi:hypothetical protein